MGGGCSRWRGVEPTTGQEQNLARLSLAKSCGLAKKKSRLGRHLAASPCRPPHDLLPPSIHPAPRSRPTSSSASASQGSVNSTPRSPKRSGTASSMSSASSAGGERTRPRVPSPAPSPETCACHPGRSPTEASPPGQSAAGTRGALRNTRGRVCSPLRRRPRWHLRQARGPDPFLFQSKINNRKSSIINPPGSPPTRAPPPLQPPPRPRHGGRSMGTMERAAGVQALHLRRDGLDLNIKLVRYFSPASRNTRSSR
jgi:hypothetical protein